MRTKKMITTSIFLIALGLIISAIGGFLYNTYSTLNSDNSFKDAKKDRIELKNKMNDEFNNARDEMRKHKDSLNKKVENEANTIIEELKLKSAEANKALENLKTESNKASTEISKELVNLQELTEKELAKLSLPLPNDLKIEGLSLTIKSEALQKYIPELRTQLKNFYPMTSDVEQGYQLPSGQYNPEIQNLFDGKLLKIQLKMGDDFYVYENAHKNNLYWNYNTKISLKDHNSTLHYKIINANGEEYFELSLFNSGSDRSQQFGDLRVFNGLSSALDLCDKKVWIFIDIENNLDLRVPTVSIKYLKVRDNNNKDYEIEITGTKTYHDDYLKKKLPADNKPIIGTTYLTGILKCKSF